MEPVFSNLIESNEATIKELNELLIEYTTRYFRF